MKGMDSPESSWRGASLANKSVYKADQASRPGANFTSDHNVLCLFHREFH